MSKKKYKKDDNLQKKTAISSCACATEQHNLLYCLKQGISTCIPSFTAIRICCYEIAQRFMHFTTPKRHKKYILVNINGEPVNALIYIMNNGFEKALPGEEYFNEVLDGYIENNLETEPLFQAMFDVKAI